MNQHDIQRTMLGTVPVGLFMVAEDIMLPAGVSKIDTKIAVYMSDVLD